MKKYVFGLFAVALAVAFSAYRVAPVSFHFIPPTGSEGLYEAAASWEVQSTNAECNTGAVDPCIVTVEQTLLPAGATLPARFAAYLQAQPSATTKVNQLTISKKP